MPESDFFSDIMTGVCINCDESCACYLWFCPTCVEVKETAYAVSRTLGETWVDVIIRREAALQERRETRKAKEA